MGKRRHRVQRAVMYFIDAVKVATEAADEALACRQVYPSPENNLQAQLVVVAAAIVFELNQIRQVLDSRLGVDYDEPEP